MRSVHIIGLIFAVAVVAGCNHDDNGVVGPPHELREVYHQHPAWSPDGNAIAFWSQPKNFGETPIGVWLFHLQDSTLSFVINGNLPKWSPDGLNLTVSIEAQIAVVNLATGEAKTLTNFGRNWYTDYSPGGQWIVFDRTSPVDSSGLWIVSADGFSEPRRISHDLGGARSPVWSPDGNLIAFARRESGSTQWRIWAIRPDGSDLRRLSAGDSNEMFPAWSPDGMSIAYTAMDGVHVLNLTTREDRQLEGTDREWLASYQGVSWSPDGHFLVYNKEDLWIIEPDGRNNRQLTGPEGVIQR